MNEDSLGRLLSGLTRWDGQYFTEIAKDGYVSEQHLAFFPLYPIAMQTFGRLLMLESTNTFEMLPRSNLSATSEVNDRDYKQYLMTASMGVILNNVIFFPIATVSLFLLTKLVVRKDRAYGLDVIWWFCFNPASIFFSACYTESLFTSLTFTAMLLIEYQSQKYYKDSEVHRKGQSKASAGEPFNRFSANQLLAIYLPCLGLMALSTATRSNGLVTIWFLIYQFLLKYRYLPEALNRAGWSIWTYLYTSLAILHDAAVLVMASTIAASGYITFQIYSFIKFCSATTGNFSRPSWCDGLIPHPYGHVQAKYWNVGLFKYYQLKQLPNFLLASPIIYLVLAGSLAKTKQAALGANWAKQFPYYIHSVVVTLLCTMAINIQVTTRLLASSSPVVYWICADTTKDSRCKRNLIQAYFLTYFCFGTILFCNFYPWT